MLDLADHWSVASLGRNGGVRWLSLQINHLCNTLLAMLNTAVISNTVVTNTACFYQIL